MSLARVMRCLPGRQVLRPTRILSYLGQVKRGFADTTNRDASSKQVMVQGTENEEHVRVRRARPADVPRVLRFVREHARAAWPGLVAPPQASHLVLCDYVARALAQGHSMLAEQQEARRGWSQIRGLALGAAICPWDATMLEKWARCVRCAHSRRLMHFSAHCLRAPALHDKYHVHNILQVILLVPQDTPRSAEIVHVLAKNAIQRGRDCGFELLRFDVTDDFVAKTLDGLQLKKEWQLTYDALPDLMSDKDAPNQAKVETRHSDAHKGSFIAVYTAATKQQDKEH